MRLVDDQQIQFRHGGQVALSRQRRDHGEGHLAAPGLGCRVQNRGCDRWVHPAKLLAVLRRQLVAVGKHTSFGIRVADSFASNRRKHNRFACPCRRDAERVVSGCERRQAALDEEFLAGTQTHGLWPHSAQLGRPENPDAGAWCGCCGWA